MEVARLNPSNDDGSEAPFDLSRLRPEERELWDQHFAASNPEEGDLVRVWSFGHVCMLELWGPPEVVSEWLRDNDLENTVMQYMENVRRARGEGYLRHPPTTSSDDEL
jgi:hypothetical protein